MGNKMIPLRKLPRPKKKKKVGRKGFADMPRTDPRRIKHEQKVADVLALRLQGWSVRAIGGSVNLGKSQVHKLIDDALKEMGVRDKTEDLRTLEMARLDEITVGVFPKAAAGDNFAVDSYLKIQQRRMAIAGVAPPSTLNHTISSPDGGPVEHTVRTIADAAAAFDAKFAQVIAEASAFKILGELDDNGEGGEGA